MMRCIGIIAWRVLLLGSLLCSSIPAAGQQYTLEPAEACMDFVTGGYPGSAWTYQDCVDVWKRFAVSVPRGLHRRMPDVDIWKEVGMELRRTGSPCLVASNPTSDGAGSSTIRHLAAWIFAEQMGCDWVTPDWGKKSVEGTDGSVLYCHRAATTDEMVRSRPAAAKQALRRCSILNWLSYFQFDVPSVERPKSGTIKIIEAAPKSTENLESVKEVLETVGFANRPWEHVMVIFHPTLAAQHLVSVGSWDDTKRQTVRRVLREARQNFHRHPRPWYDENPKCAFDRDKLNFAIHVRMGDRREFQGNDAEYYQLLELFMDTVTAGVVKQGLAPPLFHIFSETLIPCPCTETGLFDEFPLWPVELDQIPACSKADTPEDCPEKQAGVISCSPNRTGIFYVQEKPIVLHVGPDVRNAMSCMIQSDGVLMGCSTFGQVAGLLTKGLRFFSMECGGANTPEQYKTIPPLAIAERGERWVPVAGSWRDPVIASTLVLNGALDLFLTNRDTSA